MMLVEPYGRDRHGRPLAYHRAHHDHRGHPSVASLGQQDLLALALAWSHDRGHGHGHDRDHHVDLHFQVWFGDRQ